MSWRARKTLPIFFILLVSLIAAGLILRETTPHGYLRKARSLYGPPDPALSQIALLQLSIQLVSDQEELLNSSYPAPGQPLPFTIEPGESPAEVIARLKNFGLVRSEKSVRNYLVYTGYDTHIQAGSHMLNTAMSPVELFKAMVNLTRSEVTFVILAGWRVEEIAESLGTSGIDINAKKFIKSAATQRPGIDILADLPGGLSLEGYLMAGTYQIKLKPAPTADSLILTFVQQLKDSITADMIEGFKRNGLNLHQAVTLASIIEREAIAADEMPLIASVFYNRLAAKMRLETDPTVQYALGYNRQQKTWWTNPLSLADLEVESTYNTYLHSGLPPGPISSPSLEALLAVAFPAETTYYYFRAACGESDYHNFAETFQEHLDNSCD